MTAKIYYAKVDKASETQLHVDHIAGERLLGKALEEAYGINLEHEPRSCGTHGKPFLTRQPAIHYNISHSGEYVICVLASEEVGIDIQEHKPMERDRMMRILSRLTPEELTREIAESQNALVAFYTQWVLRESYVKWTGEGFSKDLRKIDLEDGWHELLRIDPAYSTAIWAAKPMEIEIKRIDL